MTFCHSRGLGRALQQHEFALDPQLFGDAPAFSVALRSCERFPDRCASRNYLPGSGHPLRKHSEKCRITRDRSGLAKLTESVVEKLQSGVDTALLEQQRSF